MKKMSFTFLKNYNHIVVGNTGLGISNILKEYWVREVFEITCYWSAKLTLPILITKPRWRWLFLPLQHYHKNKANETNSSKLSFIAGAEEKKNITFANENKVNLFSLKIAFHFIYSFFPFVLKKIIVVV